MIQAASWFTPNHHGVLATRASRPPSATNYPHPSTQRSQTDPQESFYRDTPTPPTESDLLTLIARPIKYFSRMTPETQLALCAASLALRSTIRSPSVSEGPAEIGLLAAGFDGTLAANTTYFQDYITSGRSLARGNLFIYTLPTSALSAISLALSLQGPALHLHNPAAPLAALLHHAHQMLADQEADTLLALYTDPTAAICLAIDPAPHDASSPLASLFDPPSTPHLDFSHPASPTEFAATLRALVPQP